jgi:hypothetical protein
LKAEALSQQIRYFQTFSHRKTFTIFSRCYSEFHSKFGALYPDWSVAGSAVRCASAGQAPKENPELELWDCSAPDRLGLWRWRAGLAFMEALAAPPTKRATSCAAFKSISVNSVESQKKSANAEIAYFFKPLNVFCSKEPAPKLFCGFQTSSVLKL